MESHELLREVYRASCPKQIAAELKLSLSLIYKWAEPRQGRGSGAANPLDRLATLIRVTGDTRLAQWICEQAGGFFVRNPRAAQGAEQLVPATNAVVQEFADLLSVIATAAADDAITPREAAAIRARWEDLKSVTEGFVRCCEVGNFSPMRQPAAARAPD
ncbi:MAG: hypothetical protein D6766_01920 [Verrucomicrobia bacterium]|nr:MAG: hypothetical protein D6766_01920 [Verrucomicrobiota bacterium]